MEKSLNQSVVNDQTVQASVPVVAMPIHRVQGSIGRRQCGPCTACCDGWLEAEILGHRMFPGQPCHFRGESGCTIYEQRPRSPCKTFVCGYLAVQSPFPETFRPDLLKVVIVVIKWRNAPAYILLSAGQDPDEATLTWMREHTAKTGHPFFYQQGSERFGFGPSAFLQEMAQRLQRGQRLW